MALSGAAMGAMDGMTAQGIATTLDAAKDQQQLSEAGAVGNIMKTLGSNLSSASQHQG
ncbi:hypothetical protein [Paraburkholderia ginsengiterrae]|uniref:hypothetical protein n=1 Tax=Paraburkholderia ginsengiterrae TaxID=1462993 RepID=UPI000B0D0CB5|nr:hypothetical protein [Paraburkholderia ginsengiterrae]